MNRPIIALDFGTMDDVSKFLQKFDEPLFVKVGMELYLQNGPSVVREIRAMGHDIFLDLKLHDIPNTVGRAMEGLGRLDVRMTNVHAQGGTAMMKRARESFKDGNPDGILIAVTQLTSMSGEMVRDELNSSIPLDESVLHYAGLAKDSGLDGVVSSPLEARAIHQQCGDEFLTVTPGIRTKDSNRDDQVRVMTPGRARGNGSDYIVVGRPITKAEDPLLQYQKIKSDWESGGEQNEA